MTKKRGNIKSGLLGSNTRENERKPFVAFMVLDFNLAELAFLEILSVGFVLISITLHRKCLESCSMPSELGVIWEIKLLHYV